MSLSSQSFNHASMVAKVMIAMHQAALGHGQAYVLNRYGHPVASVRYRPGECVPFRFYRGNRDITTMVRSGVRQYHHNKRMQGATA